ncbi:MAG: GIY-YIG nuclease family protein [Patescibacteria group bacterium]|nr:GIY-YIG nuclease family protein [Patescibacteria group bacterium]
MNKKLQDKIKVFPKTPGVYLFFDTQKTVLYVGKATSLKDRVKQYFSGQDTRGERIENMVTESDNIKIIETDSVLEALLLEAELIKKYQPKYNIEGKDDKSFSYFVITHEKFSRVVILHGTDFDKKKFQTSIYKKGRVFGPYTSRDQMRIALKIIRKIFPFHNRSEKSEKGCLSYQIGLCPGPYDGAITLEDYKRNMRNISLFLSGRKKKLLKDLNKEMKNYAKDEEFEQAEKVKRQIFALEHINDIALIQKDFSPKARPSENLRFEAYDISHISGDYMVASMVVFVNGVSEKSQYRKFKVKATIGINDIGAMREVLARRMNHLDDWGVPQLIILDGGKGHINMADDLWNKLDISIPVVAVAKGPTRKKLDIYKSAVIGVDDKLLKDKILIENLREEAHRFAIKYHKQLREKDQLK